MAKLVAVIRALAEAAGIKGNQEVDAVLGASALAEIDFPDTAVATLNNNLLTRERALADPDLVRKARVEAKGFFMDMVDDRIKLFLTKLPEDIQGKVKEEKDTLKKLDLLKGYVDGLDPAAASKSDEKARKAEEELRAKIADLTKEISDNNLKFAAEKEEFILDQTLKSEIFGYKLPDNLVPIKNTIADGVIKNLKSKGLVLKLNKANPSLVDVFREVDGALKDFYEDGSQTKLTFKAALDKEMEPYTIKNNNGGEGGQGGQGGNGGQGGQGSYQVPKREPTLHEMMQG